jgi:hypothetical protein
MGHFAMMSKELLKVLWSENGDLGEEKLTLDERSGSIIEYSPHWNQVL